MEALRQHMEQQERDRLSAGELWQEHGLVFASRVGTPLSANNVIRAFRIITKKAGLGEDWVPPRDAAHLRIGPVPPTAFPWKASPCSPDTSVRLPPSRSTATRSVRHLPKAQK